MSESGYQRQPSERGYEQTYLQPPQKSVPAPSDISSALSVPDRPFPDRVQAESNRVQTSSSQADRNAELGIPQLPLATITSSSFGATSGSQNLKEMGVAFNSALGDLTQAIFRSADALQSGRTASSTTSAFFGPPQPLNLASEQDDAKEGTYYNAPFTKYASLDTSAYDGFSKPRQPVASSADVSGSARSEEIQGFDLYFDLNSDEIDLTRFKSELVGELRSIGAEEYDLSSLTIEVRAGRITVLISGPASSIQAVSRLPLRNIRVSGCRALLSKDELSQDEVALTGRSFARSQSTTSSQAREDM
jgi:hypothetical protein